MGEISNNYYNKINQVEESTFDKILNTMHELYKKKNSDYGNSFNQTLDEFGEEAALIRISDKYNRLKSLYKLGNPNFESINDTLIDLASYCVMTLAYRKDNEL